MAINKLPNGKYRVDFYAHGANSKRIKRVFPTLQLAQAFYEETRSNISFGSTLKVGDNPTLNDLIVAWYNLHGKTLRSGQSRAKEMLAASTNMGNPLASKFTPQMFQRYRMERINRGISTNTVNHDLTYFNAMFNELSRTSVFPFPNPLSKLKKLKFHQAAVTDLSESQVRRLFDALKRRKGDAYLVSLVCLATGARWSEAVNLTYKDITNGQVAFKVTKNHNPRYVPITVHLEGLLKNRLKKGNFKNPASTFKRVFKELGLDKETPKGQLTHMLRHTFASGYLCNGGDILSLQKALGHSTIQMTMRYVHFASDFLKDVPEKNPASTILHISDSGITPIKKVEA